MFPVILCFVLWCQEEILEGLDKLCRMLPASMNDSCKAFVDKYVPAIIALLRQEVDAAQVCALIGVCSAQKSTTMLGLLVS